MRILWVLVACVALVAGVAQGVAAGAQRQSAPPRHQIEVVAGDTLWGLGTRYAPAGTDLRVWVDRVEVANGLHSAALRPGQVLTLPS